MSLFDGVQNFTPAFEAEKMAMEQGKNVSQALTSGVQTGMQMGSQMRQARQEKGQMKMLDGWMKSRNSAIGSFQSPEQFKGDTSEADPLPQVTDSPTPWN